MLFPHAGRVEMGVHNWYLLERKNLLILLIY